MTGSEYALQIVGLTKSFGGLPVTRNVSLAIKPGERRLIIGPNGAGKTTLFNQITGELAPDAGRIKLFGRDITRSKPQQRAHLGMSRTYQILTLFKDDDLEHNIALGLLGLRGARWDMLRPLSAYGEIKREALRVLGLVGLEHQARQPVSAIAYGEKRRVEIAMALSQNPKVLLLDEPLAGLSAPEREAVKALINSIGRGTTVVMIEHDMDTALDMAETVTLLHYGEVLVDGERDMVVRHEKTLEVYLGH